MKNERIIGLSTGSLYNWDPEVLSKGYNGISILLNSKKANGIEILFYYPETLLNSKMPGNVNKLLSKFKYISIHAPWCGIKYDNSSKSEKVLDKLREHAKKIHANGVVFHLPNITDMSILNQSDLPVLIENTRKNERGYFIEGLSEVLKYDNLDYALDIAHLFQINLSYDNIKKITNLMRNRLKEIHLSGIDSSRGKIQKPLCKTSKKYREKIIDVLLKQPIVPIIIESKFPAFDTSYFDQEIDFIISVLNNYNGRST